MVVLYVVNDDDVCYKVVCMSMLTDPPVTAVGAGAVNETLTDSFDPLFLCTRMSYVAPS